MGSPKNKRQLSRNARGYTNAHVARRRQLEPIVATGQVSCCRCGLLIEPGQPWHLDHRDDRRGYLGAATPPATSALLRTKRTAPGRTSS
jgi:hypothetical protein